MIRNERAVTLKGHSLLACGEECMVMVKRLRWLDTVFPGSIPPKFEHKLRRHKQSFRKIATTVVLDKDENLL